MQLESERAKVPLTTAGPGQSHAGEQENSILTAQKATDWLIIYSFFTSNCPLPPTYDFFRKLPPPPPKLIPPPWGAPLLKNEAPHRKNNPSPPH